MVDVGNTLVNLIYARKFSNCQNLDRWRNISYILVSCRFGFGLLTLGTIKLASRYNCFFQQLPVSFRLYSDDLEWAMVVCELALSAASGSVIVWGIAGSGQSTVKFSAALQVGSERYLWTGTPWDDFLSCTDFLWSFKPVQLKWIMLPIANPYLKNRLTTFTNCA